jgi:hypothetical protein
VKAIALAFASAVSVDVTETVTLLKNSMKLLLVFCCGALGLGVEPEVLEFDPIGNPVELGPELVLLDVEKVVVASVSVVTVVPGMKTVVEDPIP